MSELHVALDNTSGQSGSTRPFDLGSEPIENVEADLTEFLPELCAKHGVTVNRGPFAEGGDLWVFLAVTGNTDALRVALETSISAWLQDRWL